MDEDDLVAELLYFGLFSEFPGSDIAIPGRESAPKEGELC